MGPGGPPITPGPNQTRRVPVFNDPSKLANSGLGKLRGFGMVGPPSESARQGNFNFRIGINFFKKPSNRRLHLKNMSMDKDNGVIGDGVDVVPGPAQGHDVR